MKNFKLVVNEDSLLSEAKFSVEKIDKVIDLLASLASKYAKGKFSRVEWKEWGVQDFVKSDGTKGTGILFMNKGGERIRIGYAQTRSMKKARMEVNAIDYWDSTNKSFDKCTRSVVC